VISTQEVRIILDRNQNGLDGRPAIEAGAGLPPGLYWDQASRSVAAVEATRTADRRYVLLSNRIDITADELVRELAMGGGGPSGRPVPYHQGARPGAHH
jgi:hypothetical protein